MLGTAVVALHGSTSAARRSPCPPGKPSAVPALVMGGALVAVIAVGLLVSGPPPEPTPRDEVALPAPYDPARSQAAYETAQGGQTPAPVAVVSEDAWRAEFQRIASNVETHLEFVAGDSLRIDRAVQAGDDEDARFWAESVLMYSQRTLEYMEEGIAHLGSRPAGIGRVEFDGEFAATRRDLQRSADEFRAEVARLEEFLEDSRDPDRERRRQEALDEALRQLDIR